MANSFGSKSTLDVGKRKFEIHKLSALEKAGLAPGRLPFSLRILLENLLRHEDGHLVCPWHQSAYDVHTGRMVRGPQGAFAKVPGLDAAYRALTRVLPLRRGQVLERNGRLFVR